MRTRKDDQRQPLQRQRNANQSNDLDKELTKALDESIANLSDRFDDILRRHKNGSQVDLCA